MKVVVTRTKDDNVEFSLDKEALRLDGDDLAAFLAEAIKVLEDLLAGLVPNNNHL